MAADLPDINAIRRRNLRIIVERAGGLTEFCKQFGVSSQRVHALVRTDKPRNIGDQFARRAETVFGYRKNWLDHLNAEPSLVADALEKIEQLRAAEGKGSKTSQSDSLQTLLQDIERARQGIRKQLGLEMSNDGDQNVIPTTEKKPPVTPKKNVGTTLPKSRAARRPRRNKA